MSSAERPGVVDFAYLEGFVGGDVAIALEVLTLFREQTGSWAQVLASAAPGWRETAHTIKGAARGIGARDLGDAADRAEFGTETDLPALSAALNEAVEAIDAYMAQKAA